MQVKDCLWEGSIMPRKYTIDDFVGRTVVLSIAKNDRVFRINGIMFNDKMKQVWYPDFPIDKLPEFGESLLCKLVILDFPPHNYCFL